MDVLLGQQHREPFLFELDDGVGHLLDDHRRHALRRLVEQHQQRLPISVRATVSICCSPPLICTPRRWGHLAQIGEDREELFRRP